MSEARWFRRPGVLWRRSLDAVVFLGPEEDEPHTLLGGGPEVWELLIEPRTLAGLVAALADRHDTGSAVLERDVLAVLDQLQRLGAVVRLDEN